MGDSVPAADVPTDYSVGIIGAGVAGMFTAMIFDYLNDRFGTNVKYDILEAEGEHRVGGRLYTYKFPQRANQPEPGVHDYYDVGAMRFPKIQYMERLFQLVEYEPLNKGKHKLKTKLIPYYFTPNGAANSYLLYNNVRLTAAVAKKVVEEALASPLDGMGEQGGKHGR